MKLIFLAIEFTLSFAQIPQALSAKACYALAGSNYFCSPNDGKTTSSVNFVYDYTGWCC